MKKPYEKIAAFVFGTIFVIVMLTIAIAIPNPTPTQYQTFRIVLAIAVAGVAAMVPGFLEVQVNTFIRAGGALAVFVIVYFYNPAMLVVAPPPNPVVVHSGSQLSGAGAGWSPWYRVCGDAPDGTRTKSVRFSLSGDRTSCGAWSECREASRDERRVCYEFRLQGHSEWNPPGQAASEGTLELTWEIRK